MRSMLYMLRNRRLLLWLLPVVAVVAAGLAYALTPREQAGYLLDAISIQSEALAGLMPPLDAEIESRREQLEEDQELISLQPVNDALTPESPLTFTEEDTTPINRDLVFSLPSKRQWAVEIVTLMVGTAQIQLLPKIPDYIYNIRMSGELGSDIQLANKQAIVQTKKGGKTSFLLVVPQKMDPADYVQLFKFYTEAGQRVARVKRQGYVQSALPLEFELSTNARGGVPDGFLLWQAKPVSKLARGEYGLILNLPPAAEYVKGYFTDLGNLESVVYDFSVD